MTPTTPEQATFIAGFLSTSQVASNAIYSLTSQIQSITKERDALAAAGKLAVAALDDWYYGVNQDRPKATVFAALQALKAASVK